MGVSAATASRRASAWGRTAIALGLVAVAAIALSACGSSDADESAETTGAAGAYPLTIATCHGDVTIDGRPERIVALSPTSADEALSLGAEPAAVAADPATLEETYPWIVDEIAAISDATLSAPTGELNLEAIAATRPDLILAQPWQVADKAVFDRLNSIAPTVVPDSEALNVDWDERLRTTALALGATEDAEALIADIESEFGEVGASVPDISSKTYQFVRADPDGFGFGNGSVLELFGLTPADNQDNTQNGPPLSKERTAELDADVLGVWPQTDERRIALTEDPLFSALPAVQKGTVFYPDLAMATAANTPAPMALRWVQAKLTPTIRALG